MTGSFCTFDKALNAFELLSEDYDLTPVMSDNAYGTDTRFGAAEYFRQSFESICGKPILHRIVETEPVGPEHRFDLLVIAPCTGNTLSKLAHGITDTPVLMAAKSHLRNGYPLLIALSTNDALSGSAPNIAALLCRKNIYFVPFYQDDSQGKPTSLVSDYSVLPSAVEAALAGRQLQPMLSKI